MILRALAPMLTVLVLGPAAPSAPATELCATAGPGSVCECLEEAVSNQDVEAFRALFSADYVGTHLAHPEMEYDRDFRVGGFQSMFENPDQEIQLEVECGEPSTGQAPGTWILKEALVRLHFKGIPGSGGDVTDAEVEGRFNMFIREVPEPSLHYEIFREEEIAAEAVPSPEGR